MQRGRLVAVTGHEAEESVAVLIDSGLVSEIDSQDTVFAEQILGLR